MNRIKVSLRAGLIALTLSFAGAAQGLDLKFNQLDWLGLSSSTPDSRWGQVNLDFTGYSTLQYFNLSVNGNWVVRNMGVDSLFGSGAFQTLTTTFDLGISGDVKFLDYSFFIDSSPIDAYPLLPEAQASVADLAYRIGGEGGVDLGSPGAPPAPAGGNKSTVVDKAKLPNVDKVKNQVQGPNECAPGAISNSLKYLQATGKLADSVKTDISDIKPIVDWDADGAPQDWYRLKGESFKDVVTTTVLGPTDIQKLIDAVNAGKDVELDLDGHVAMIVGVRRYSDGRVELDIFDDNQTDDKVDPMRTVEIVGGKVDGKGIDGFVVEAPVPEPGTLSLFAVGGLALVWLQRRRQAALPPRFKRG